MYVTDICLEGLGPLPSLKITPRFRQDGAPVPIVLVGQNGSGKSLTLSVLLDAMIEAKKLGWHKIPEITHEQYLRLMSTSYVRVRSDYSLTQLRFESGEAGFTYRDLVSRLDAEGFRTKFPNFRLDGRDISGQLLDRPFLKQLIPNGDIKRVVNANLLLYFPYFRYEQPAWLNAESPTSLGLRDRLVGITDESVVQVNVVVQISRWLLDVVLDRELYERVLSPVRLEPNGPEVQLFGGYRGPNATTVNLIQEVLKAIYAARDSSVTRARFGINPKGSRQVAIFVQRGQTEELVTPSIGQMSSGELMLLSLCCSIIRAHDTLRGGPAPDLAAITGVVLIDEIDLHLHIGLQKEVLPNVIRMFPRVQFILTTHSPFFLLGMADKGEDAADIYSLPIGARILPTDFSEFQAGYDVFIEKDEQFKRVYENLAREVATATRPLVVTEGKTDWKHAKAALARLKEAGHYPTLEIELLEYGDGVDMGDSRLAEMCEHFAKATHPRRVIFMFDRDSPKVVGRMAGDAATGFKRWNEQVFSFCIPVPGHRRTYTNISIEFYYTDAELRTVDQASGKRLFFTNEVEIVQRPGKRADEVRVLRVPLATEEQDKKIFDEDCTRIRDDNGVQLGHSKSVFADRVLTGAAGFNAFEVDEFRRIFDIINTISAASPLSLTSAVSPASSQSATDE